MLRGARKEDAMTPKVSRGSTPLFKPPPPPGEIPYYLDVPAFQAALDTALKNNSVFGYVAQLRQHGQALFTNTWQFAIGPQDQGSELWTPDVQMHVASVSKLMTAMAMMVLFRDNNISPDA
jgi:CubicO group peptidase (beta-lactamase class C family)